MKKQACGYCGSKEHASYYDDECPVYIREQKEDAQANKDNAHGRDIIDAIHNNNGVALIAALREWMKAEKL